MGKYYNKDGRKFPSCTTIIADCTNSSAPLIQWGANCVAEWIKQNCEMIPYPTPESENNYLVHPDELDKARFEFRNVSKKACDIGSEVHNAIEKHLQGLDYTLTTKGAERSFQAFLDWEKEVNLKPIKLEHTVWGNRWAGTLDMVCELNDKICVVDFKTSKKIYPSEMGAQIAAYRSCIPKAVGQGILRLDKEFGFPEWKDFSKRYEQDLIVFNFMVDLFYARHPKIRKKFEETPWPVDR